MDDYDYIIVGQGIAGTVLAQTFLQYGKSVYIVDEPSFSSASKVAAGVYNPVVFKRLVKSWMADELIPCMDEFYKRAEILLENKFYFKKEIVKLFVNEEEQNLWVQKSQQDGTYLSTFIHQHYLPGILSTNQRAAHVKNAGNLDIKLYLQLFKQYFLNKNILLQEKFDHKQFQPAATHIIYKNLSAKKIIFCEGYHAIHNPYFHYLPFKLTKGELLTIQLPANKVIPFNSILNKGVFILPIGNNQYKVGATYEWNDLTSSTTEKGKQELLDKLNKIITVPVQIINHEAGIRPTVSDRRPLIGLHPENSKIGIFNGMGTKGVMIAPYFANEFYKFLNDEQPLNTEVDIKRFIS